jgi:hypothetical protein
VTSVPVPGTPLEGCREPAFEADGFEVEIVASDAHNP